MNFDFIPYRLNSSLTEFKDNIEYLDTDNGIDLYRAKNIPELNLQGLKITAVHFYSFEGSLITVYIHLSEDDAALVLAILTNTLKANPDLFRTHLGIVHGWYNESDFLGMVHNIHQNKHYLYYSDRKYNVFEDKLF